MFPAPINAIRFRLGASLCITGSEVVDGRLSALEYLRITNRRELAADRGGSGGGLDPGRDEHAVRWRPAGAFYSRASAARHRSFRNSGVTSNRRSVRSIVRRCLRDHAGRRRAERLVRKARRRERRLRPGRSISVCDQAGTDDRGAAECSEAERADRTERLRMRARGG